MNAVHCFLLYALLPIFMVSARNDAPIIGVLTQEAYAVQKFFPDKDYLSYIAASYVKFLESAGARVMPVWIGRDKEYYEKVVANTNGLFMPGGAVWFNQSDGYADAGQMLYDVALEINKQGDYYPIWGTCLGMELLLQISLGGTELRAHCSSKGVSLPLEFVTDYRKSRLFSKAPNNIIDILKKQNVTMNSHQFCVTEKNMTLFNLTDDWQVMSVNKDKFGLEFVSSFESKNYPFYGIQFHPEKNLFEFKPGQRKYVLHTLNSTLTSQYFANFFVDEARNSEHKFEDWNEEQNNLIFNYAPRFSGVLGSSYEQVYLFTKEDNQK